MAAGSTHRSGYDTECLKIFDWGFILFGATFGRLHFLYSFTARPVFVSTHFIVRNEIDFNDKRLLLMKTWVCLGLHRALNRGLNSPCTWLFWHFALNWHIFTHYTHCLYYWTYKNKFDQLQLSKLRYHKFVNQMPPTRYMESSKHFNIAYSYKSWLSLIIIHH